MHKWLYIAFYQEALVDLTVYCIVVYLMEVIVKLTLKLIPQSSSDIGSSPAS